MDAAHSFRMLVRTHQTTELLLLLHLLEHYSPLSFVLASLITNAHSLLSKVNVLYLFTPIFLKSGSTSSTPLNLGQTTEHYIPKQ